MYLPYLVVLALPHGGSHRDHCAADAEVSYVTTSARDEKRISLVDFKPGAPWRKFLHRFGKVYLMIMIADHDDHVPRAKQYQHDV